MHHNELQQIVSYLQWTVRKIEIEHTPESIYFYERELWWACLGKNFGSEENGKHQNFERPVVILKKFGKHMCLVIPLTTRIRSGDWYFLLETSHGTRCALLTQVRVLSCRRLIRRVDLLSVLQFEQLREAFITMLKK